MTQAVPFFSLTQQWQRIKPSVMPKLESLLDAQACVGGPAVADFEKAFATYTRAKHAISCSSGTNALWLALHALNLAPNSIVLTTPFSFIASASEIYAHGAHPVFIDVDADYNLDPAALTAWLDQNTEQKDGQTIERTTGYPVVGMVVVNIFGKCADYSAINRLKEQYNLWVVEDAAQSVGATHNRQQSGTLGDISCFSFYPTKNLGAAGDAGMTTTHNPELADRLMSLRNHGRHSHYNYQGYGVNARCDAIQAVILQEKLIILPDLLEKRRTIATAYTNAFKDLPGIITPHDDGIHTYHQYTISITNGISRDTFKQALEHAEIGSRIFYPELLSDISYLQTDSRLYTQCPQASRAVQQVLSLPVWPELSTAQINTVIAAVQNISATPARPETHSLRHT